MLCLQTQMLCLSKSNRAIALSKGIHKSDIEQVLLVGGSCLIPAVQQLLLSYFGRQRVKLDKPFEAIAHGALLLTQLAGIDCKLPSPDNRRFGLILAKLQKWLKLR